MYGGVRGRRELSLLLLDPAHAGVPRHAESPVYSQSLGQWNKLPPIVSHIRPDFPEPYESPYDGLRGKTSIFSHPVYLFLWKFSLQDFRDGSVYVFFGWLILFLSCESPLTESLLT